MRLWGSSLAASDKGEGKAPLQDDLLMITRKVEALDIFLATDDGRNLLAGYKRASNILKAEEKKDGPDAYAHRHAPNLRIEPQEHKLAAAIARAREETAEHLRRKISPAPCARCRSFVSRSTSSSTM